MHGKLGHKKLGAVPTERNSVLFRVWAPNCEFLDLRLKSATSDRDVRLTPDRNGLFERELTGVQAGDQYCYRLPSGACRPDPASRYQPQGVHGWSEIISSENYDWNDSDWPGLAKNKLIIYELHLGTFTQEGDYLSAIQRLDELKSLGVTAVELMPIAESPGKWNWGYDGVNFFAPRHTYGTPDQLRQFVDAAHHRGLAVLLDVVYNHFGPEGNYLHEFGGYVSDKHTTPWGDAPSFDASDPYAARFVRDFIISNACYWIEDFHLDGLRVDAIHCMADDSHPHIVTELGMAVRELGLQLRRQVHLIAESNIYDAQMLADPYEGGHGYDAEWCDDFLHSVFAVLRPGDHMSQREYTSEDLHAVLKRGYVFSGAVGRKRVREAIVETQEHSLVDLNSLVFSIQNHDFIGNHPLGQRLHQLTSDDAHRAAATLMLLYPAIPMLFMGEEFASCDPFYFFVDYSEPQMRSAVELGRRLEYPQHDWSGGASPVTSLAFEHSKLSPMTSGNPATLAWYQQAINLRKRWQARGLLDAKHLRSAWDEQNHCALLQYESGDIQQFVAVRLHPQAADPPPLTLTLDGQLEMIQNVVQQPGRQVVTIELDRYAVAVGNGSVHFSNAD
jgi:malto-oligosyltrehalose trehalohydrolase